MKLCEEKLKILEIS